LFLGSCIIDLLHFLNSLDNSLTANIFICSLSKTILAVFDKIGLKGKLTKYGIENDKLYWNDSLIHILRG